MTEQDKLMPEAGKKYRLITRSDMDGLVCGILLKDLGIIDDITFVHPKDMQDGIIEVSKNDISTNLPYMEGVYMSLDHHASEITRIGKHNYNHIIDPSAPSAARVVYDYFGGKEAFPNTSTEMMDAVDKADAAQFSKDDVLHPDGWELLSFIMDSRTGLGRFREFRISNYQLMIDLIDHCLKEQNIEDILNVPDVKERVELYKEHHVKHVGQINACTTIHDNLAIVDLRNEDTIWAGNRFIIYALYPECNISCHVLHGKDKLNTVFAVGKSIISRTSNTNVGELMLEYGGGGHHAAGTCQIDNDKAYQVQNELTQRINADG